MGLIFLRHATNRYYKALESIEADKAAGRMPNRELIEADFTRRRALMLPEAARYDVLLKRPKDGNLGSALTAAVEAVEAAFPPLAGQLPRDYQRFAGDLLERMLRMFHKGFGTGFGSDMVRIARFIGFIFATGAMLFVLAAGVLTAVVWKYEQDLPDYSQVRFLPEGS